MFGYWYVGSVLNQLANHQNDVSVIDQGMALMRQRRDAEALVLLGKIGSSDPSYVDATIHRGILFFKLDQTDRAVECLNAAARLAPDHADVHHYLGVIALETGHSQSAYESLTRARDLVPDDPDVLANLGVVQHDLGDVVGAEQNLKRCLALEPGHTHALSSLSNLYLDMNARNRYRAYADFDQFIHCSVPPIPSNEWGREEFLTKLAHEIRHFPSLRPAPQHRSTVAGSSTDAMAGPLGSAIEILRSMFISEAQTYAAKLSCANDHPLGGLSNNAFTTSMWGNVLGPGGHQSSHNHPEALLSGIYYAKIPDEVGAPESGQKGWVEFGRPREEYNGADQLDLRLIKPSAGMMILFPSYIWHRTLPLVGDAPRISVAIDFIPQSATAKA